MRAFLVVVVWMAVAAARAAADVPAAAPPAAEPPDADAKIIETTKVPFPLLLQLKGVSKGEVRLMLEIDARGRPTDCLVTAFTHREFATAAVKAINQWRYVPARIGGRPVTAIVNLTLYFGFDGPLAVEVHGPEEVPHREARYEYEPCPARELDNEPKLVISVPPKYPQDLGDAGVKGTVVVDFYIDEMGKVRFPVARQPADWRLASLAEHAVRLWEFDPPHRGGRPVLTRASTSFVFEPKPEPKS